MKYLFAAAVLVATSFASFSAANAAGGCGAGWHRGPYGGCPTQSRRRCRFRAPCPVVVVRPARSWWCGPSPRLPHRLRLGLWTLPPGVEPFRFLIESEPGSTSLFLTRFLYANRCPLRSKTLSVRISITLRKAPLARGFFCALRQCRNYQAVAEATPAERAGMPAGRTVVHRRHPP